MELVEIFDDGLGIFAGGMEHIPQLCKGQGIVFRKVLLSYMFPPEELQEQMEVGFVSATALNPASARTLTEWIFCTGVPPFP